MSLNLLRLTLFGFVVLASGTPLIGAEEVSPSSSPLARLGVEAWHAKGFAGNGVTVAVLDSGFRGYRDHLGKALPERVRTQSFRRDGNLEAKDSPHGLLCAETIHALAPGAAIVFANWEPDCPSAFLKAVQWCRAQGATIFTCSIIVPGWSDGHGGGAIHQQLAKILNDDALFFASAGNLARRHWAGAFCDNGQRVHQWRPGRTENAICPWGEQPVSIEVVGPPTSRYRLAVVDDHGLSAGQEQPLAAVDVHGSAVRFVPQAGRGYRAKVELVDGTGGEVRLIALGAELEMATAAGCMVFPGDGKEVITVGAVSPAGDRLSTSSTGTPGAILKPDCVAPVPFPCRIRQTPFGGTSAAAPQAAALAALLWSRERQATGPVIAERLRMSCLDLGPPGPDRETGYGQVRLPAP